MMIVRDYSNLLHLFDNFFNLITQISNIQKIKNSKISVWFGSS